ncbi:hypothetical protein B0T21DRAFT_298756 [Apiosordaria backusii]|uniref:RRM domain-containing protein n=1 Tax=Apiosordaria backusii TaxID=314023 RepID=A0AA40A122_9PEZI|nr:hypothetical protein B0T21DRAFT_298756 [Apiosordaria backusii]
MDAVLHRGARANTSSDEKRLEEEREMLGFSKNYKGDIYNKKNQPPIIPEEDNVSLFITNLPAELAEDELLKGLISHGPFGKVYSVSMVPPDQSKGQTGAAAKLVMFTREAAEKVYGFIAGGGLKFHEKFNTRTAIVTWNQVKHAAYDGQPWKSRVLTITGPKNVIDIESIESALKSNIVYQTEQSRVLWETITTRAIEWRFCSVLAQAEAASLMFRRLDLPGVTVKYGLDPLDVPVAGKTQAAVTKTQDAWEKLGAWRRGL